MLTVTRRLFAAVAAAAPALLRAAEKTPDFSWADHHKRAPYENLYTSIDAGAGTRLWMSGGGAALGRHCAARGASRMAPSPKEWAPATIVLAGLTPQTAERRKLQREQLRRRSGREE